MALVSGAEPSELIATPWVRAIESTRQPIAVSNKILRMRLGLKSLVKGSVKSFLQEYRRLVRIGDQTNSSLVMKIGDGKINGGYTV